MPVSAAAFVLAFGLVLGGIVWLLTTMKTTAEGYTKIAALDALEIEGAEEVLRKAGIPTILEDHRFKKSGDEGGGGFIHVFVPTVGAHQAIALLKRERSHWAMRPLTVGEDRAHSGILQHPAWNRRTAPRALLVMLGFGALAGFLSVRANQQFRQRCLNEYAAALSAVDTVRADQIAFQWIRGGTRYCRSFRQQTVR